MALLTRDQIVAIDDIKTERVNVPEWGGEVIVRGLSAKEAGSVSKATTTIKKGSVQSDYAMYGAKLLCLAIVDEDGKRIFSDSDANFLASKGSATITRLVEVVNRLSGLSEDELEEMRKNLESSQGEDSNSD